VAREQDGVVTLTELFIASALALIVFGAGITLVSASQNTHDKTKRRSEAVLDARDGLERIVREARTAIASSSPASPQVSGSSLVFQRVAAGANPNLPIASQPRQWIRWTCSGTSCDRTSSATYPPPASGGQTLVTGLQNSDVFAIGTLVTGGPINYLTVKLDIGVGGSGGPRPVELLDGVVMRNVP
jgi:hypothetical protein